MKWSRLSLILIRGFNVIGLLVAGYLFTKLMISSIDWEWLSSILIQLLKGFGLTVAIFGFTLLFSMPLGMALCNVRMSRLKILSWPAKLYISIMRGTPLMLQILIIFFGPYYVFQFFNLDISLSDAYRFPAVIIAFSLNYAAYFAEIYRAGIESIPIGQYEAANVLGYSRLQTFFKIILPQVIKRTLPPVTNEIITLTKDTSLAYAVACAEMFTIAKQLAASQSSMAPFVAAAVFYYIFNFVVAYVMERCERKLNYYQ